MSKTRQLLITAAVAVGLATAAAGPASADPLSAATLQQVQDVQDTQHVQQLERIVERVAPGVVRPQIWDW
ncbi:hypothetical protein [Rathayibacter sp. VKM Ac-2801]|jgi:TolA-binding protein|uniref:hypothetical protein n=1 Tax=Rathayibacter sp. VKM Ac-2801 TaxID=2609255 RepID=UPI00132054A1|nr:hypothetical protein [Rathayibacter sp. VKM Ac-2801]QHC71263.1 hypothetical protein GSU45_13315 [Rathayibacter sp. VKM Ac-2801]